MLKVSEYGVEKSNAKQPAEMSENIRSIIERKCLISLPDKLKLKI